MQAMQAKGQIKDPTTYGCVLCSDLKGIIVNTNIGRVHITCVNWIPDIWFDDVMKTVIGGKLNATRAQLNCAYCKGKNKKKTGSCI